MENQNGSGVEYLWKSRWYVEQTKPNKVNTLGQQKGIKLMIFCRKADVFKMKGCWQILLWVYLGSFWFVSGTLA